jgi:uncharacterized protein YbjQ (UPF0145 family)
MEPRDLRHPQAMSAPLGNGTKGGDGVRIEDIEIHAGTMARPHRVIGEISAKVGAATMFSKAPTIEDVNFKLREEALKKGANAVINVEYGRGISAMSWKALTASGTAVFAESDERKCPFCAELIKREAIRCKHCGADLPSPSKRT